MEIRKGCEFFSYTKCEYYPCHKMSENEEINCLFCYCPLYFLNEKCGGNFIILKNGLKSCENCLIPHSAGGYKYINYKLLEINSKIH